MVRTRLRAFGAVALLLLSAASAEAARRRSVRHPEPVFDLASTEGGYADRTSVAQGGQITLHISTSVSPFKVSIVNLADQSVVIHEVQNLTSSVQNCSGQFTSGCGWLATHTMTIPHGWPSGYYAALFPTSFGERRVIFVVRENDPGSTSSVLLVSPTSTYQAYNEFGGRSFYPSDSPRRAARLSFDRPYHQDRGIGRYDTWERKFVDWMTQERRTFEVVTDSDLEDPTLLANYNLVLLVGHSEYWTSEARRNLETFSRNGGHVAVFGGCSMWWQVRFDDNGRTLVGYKDAVEDPIRETDAQLVTTHFWSAPINLPENLILGSSFRFGGYSNRVDDPNSYDMLPLEQRIGYLVTEENHWVFQGASVARGTAFGREVAGLEVDGALFNCASTTGVMTPDGADGTPLNYHILAVTPASEGHGTIGIYTNAAGGAVFNAGTQNWVYGLASDPLVQTVTRNVLDRLSAGQLQVYDGVSSPILTQELFNCPLTSKTLLPGWQSDGQRGQVTAECAYEGPAGLRLSGSAAISISRDFTPIGEARNHAEVRFYVKVDDLAKRNQYPAPFVTLRSRVGSNVLPVVHAEFDVIDGKKSVRVARRDPRGGFFASDWITLAAGWHLVELSWRSPGTITLQVDGASSRSLDNLDENQFATELFIEYPRAEGPDSGHACIDAIAVATEKLGPVPALIP
jgi:hypothetical protein